ncbi:S-adenosyl-L-methionine-dependent methyltransferase [Hypoxylon rubiginosum]|uniref:S-adenosyl-L-methionine-dependent methyltransferase n=1 Tax=Hypoxylon rubiginosum TaxID=110542 RepID=A0ACB9YZX7_9PEZI|nr:S-adenosyl-L-methionine-dependent methyltransferase [Hypoxylon rubiginosum]
MPRLPPSLLRRAHSISPHLAALLPVCRDLASARHELRWIREHVADLLLPSRPRPRTANDSPREHARNALLTRLCRRRGAGAPLQYVLGSQPFGDLDIQCRPGVLIPRPETEAWASHLADVIVRSDAGVGAEGDGLRVLDLCLGTGCVALLLHSLLQRRFSRLSVCGFDVDGGAVALARRNRAHNERRGLLSPRSPDDDSVVFLEADIFAPGWLEELVRHSGGRERGKGPVVDVLVSNPPYVSARGFNQDTARSVRNYEPKRALVPLYSPHWPELGSADADDRPEDVFYVRLLEIFEVVQPRFAVFEVGDLAQAYRVVQMAFRRFGGVSGSDVKAEIWRDWPDMRPQEDEAESMGINGIQVPIEGSGNGRAVFIRRNA